MRVGVGMKQDKMLEIMAVFHWNDVEHSELGLLAVEVGVREGEGGEYGGGGSVGEESGIGGVVVTVVEFNEAGVGKEVYVGGYDTGR